MSRCNYNGNPDSTFSGDGIQTVDFNITGAAIQSDGKIVIAGQDFNSNVGDSSVYIVERYNIDGSPDKTFGNDGKQTTHIYSANNILSSVVIENDDKILVGGTALLRYNTNGSLDKSFSGDGIVNTNFIIDPDNPVYSLALQSNGKIVIAGTTKSNSGSNSEIVRYNNDGSIDNTFSGDGMVSNSFLIASAAIQKDGKIIVGGSDNFNFALARYTVNGTADNTFAKNGKLTGNINSGYTIFKSTAIQKDRKIVVAGTTSNGSNLDFAVARYNTDGSLDNTFGKGGSQQTDFTSKDDYANSVAIQNDGKIVVAGNSGPSDSTVLSIARYNADGSPDNTFSGDGKLQTDFSGTFLGAIAKSAAIQSDGKIIVAGNFGVARFNTNGSIDKTFGVNGRQENIFAVDEADDQAVNATPYSIAIQSDGKIVVGGIYPSYNSNISVARLNIDGSLDNTFTQYNAIGDQISLTVVIQSDGKIVAGGYDFYRGDNYNYVVRLNTDGTLDTNFGYRATSLEINTYPPDNFGNSVAIQSDGKIVVSRPALTRYNTNGNLDSTFGNNGIQAAKLSEDNKSINAIAIAGNKLYGVGSATSPGIVGLIERVLLDDKSNTSPTVTLTSPTNNTTRLAPAAHIKLSAVATDKDGTISKVEFYNGTTLLHTETVFPYDYVWINVGLGNYTLTAKAYDNSGNVTTSAPVHISVVPNKAPVVSIVTPANNKSFAAPAYIHFEAAASDIDGRITRVEFYNGSTLLTTEYKHPYTYVWKDVHAGMYTVTAIATDNWGAHTTSAPVTVRVTTPQTIVSSSLSSKNDKTGLNDGVSLRLSPNPASSIVNIYTSGLQQDKQVTLSLISVSGTVLKMMHINGQAQTLQLDVSSLVSGIYTIKVISGDKILYKQFVKL